MSVIHLRQVDRATETSDSLAKAIVSVENDELLRARALLNAEIDLNFMNLNATKIERDGSIPIQDLQIGNASYADPFLTHNTITLSYDDNVLTIGAPTDTVQILGTLSAAANETVSTAEAKFIRTGTSPAVTSIAEAGGGGFQIGSYDGTSGYVNFMFENAANAWVASTGTGADINIIATDFKLAGDASLTLSSVFTIFAEINAQLGTNSVTAANDFSDPDVANITIDDTDTLTQAIGKLDQLNTPGLISVVGANDPSDVSFTTVHASIPAIASTEDESLYSVLNKINSAMLYLIHKAVTITAAPGTETLCGRLYVVQPAVDAPIIMSLPTTLRGVVAFRLDNASSDRSIKIVGDTESNPIEDGLDAYTIDWADSVVQFIWDDVEETWRVLV